MQQPVAPDVRSRLLYLELRNAFKGFSSNSEDKNVIEFQNVVRYVLKFLRIFSLNLEKRPETRLSKGHFVIQGTVATSVRSKTRKKNANRALPPGSAFCMSRIII